jgi:ribosomal protein S1
MPILYKNHPYNQSNKSVKSIRKISKIIKTRRIFEKNNSQKSEFVNNVHVNKVLNCEVKNIANAYQSVAIICSKGLNSC